MNQSMQALRIGHKKADIPLGLAHVEEVRQLVVARAFNADGWLQSDAYDKLHQAWVQSNTRLAPLVLGVCRLGEGEPFKVLFTRLSENECRMARYGKETDTIFDCAASYSA